MDKQATYDDISEVIKEQVDNFRFRRPCIIDGHEALISKTESEIISYDQSVNDFIIEQLNDSESHDFIRDLTEFGMAANYITTNELRGIHIQHISPASMHAVNHAIIGLKHNMIIVDDIESSKIREPDILKFEFPKLEEVKENHPYRWYRKFEKKRF